MAQGGWLISHDNMDLRWKVKAQGANKNRPLEIVGIVAWRIIPVSKWLITTVSKSPNWGCSPYTWPKWLIHGGY